MPERRWTNSAHRRYESGSVLYSVNSPLFYRHNEPDNFPSVFPQSQLPVLSPQRNARVVSYRQRMTFRSVGSGR